MVGCMDGSGATDFGNIEEAKTAVTEAIVGVDDAVMEKYLAGEVSDEEVRRLAPVSVAKGELVPIVFTGAVTNAGIEGLLDAVVGYGPNPLGGKRRVLVDGEASTELEPNADGDVVG